MWEFYLNTMDRKWGRPYLNRRFFELIYENFRHRLVMVMARDKSKWVGGSFNIVKNNRLFGRYWGTIKEYKNLHFECCYYRLIEYAISNKIDVFEAGAQGEHKFLRGFGAVPTYSSHSFFHQGAHKAIEKFLIEERSHTTSLIDDFNRISPLKHLHR
jgi:predicted N-acyltransferase